MLDKIKDTKAYKKLEPYQKTLITKRKNVMLIEHHLEVIKNAGFDQWEKINNANYLNKLIVNEIHNSKNQ